ncbi:hypothetical protein JYT36_00250 [Bacteroidales bacterium AH-315-N07]|nr:hypothetical protein [Bacteroidales bacterium AH-315-N07]
MSSPRFLVAVMLVVLAVLSRLIPHPPNFAPIGALALFGGAYFINKKHAFIIPLIAMFLSDLFLGFHNSIITVYVGFALIVFVGFKLRENKKVLPIALAAVSASIIFFIISNFGVWIFGTVYPKNIFGLMECYVMAIPFFHNTLLGDLSYTAILFGGFYIAQIKFPVLAEQKI